MSVRRRLKQIHSRGWLYTLGGWINRIVPERLMRFRVFRVYRLQPRDGFQSSPGQLALRIGWARSAAERELAQQLTYFRSGEAADPDRFRACLAWSEDQLVGGVWECGGYFDEQELGLRVLLNPDQGWIFAAFVAPQLRGAKIYPRLLNHVLHDGSARVHLASINVANRASIAAHRHFVVSQTGPCWVLRIFNFSWCWAGKGLQAPKRFTAEARRDPIELHLE